MGAGVAPLHWYTLTPYEQRLSQNTDLRMGQSWFTDAPLLPNGHTIAAALRSLLPQARITLRGPFFCRNSTLYFPSPLFLGSSTHETAQSWIPIPWLLPPASEKADRSMLWDRRKPAPLAITPAAVNQFHPALSAEQPDRPFLSYAAFLRLMQPCPNDLQPAGNCLEDQPWTIETRWHPIAETDSSENWVGVEQIGCPGWKFAIALDHTTHRKLKQRGKIFLIHLSDEKRDKQGDKQQAFWLEAQDEPFQTQWNCLQEQSEKNRRTAEQRLTHEPRTARILAYLATPGVFERKQNGITTCRNFPWEWDLAYPADDNQPRGPLVSLATTQPMPIHCRCLSNTVSANGVSENGVLASQVFAVPPGSVYYLEYPADLFQDQPLHSNGKPNRVHLWRQLGYSELFWMPYAHPDKAGF